MKKFILFVDDEIKVLDTLRKMVAPMHATWETAYAKNGLEALNLMTRMPFDVVITDLAMPAMDGPKLLTEVMRRFPQTIRFVHSTETERDKVYRSIGPAHQFLTKPSSFEVIRNAVDRALTLRDSLGGESLRKLVSRIGILPSLPTLYLQVVKAVEDPSSSLRDIGEIIGRDMGMSAKVLQLVNSAFFGIPQHVASPAQAASLLGLDILKSLVVWFNVASQFHGVSSQSFSMEDLQRHSSAVGAYAQAIAKAERFSRHDADDIFMGGLFHDMGQLILAGCLSDWYEQAISVARLQRVPMVVVEEAKLETTHAGIGAYLLALWGFANPVVEACFYHHHPERHPGKIISSVPIIYVANLLDAEFQAEKQGKAAPAYNMKYLKALGLDAHLPKWRDVCQEINRRSA